MLWMPEYDAGTAIFDLACSTPGELVSFDEAVQHAARSFEQGRADLARVTRLIRQRWGKDRSWPLIYKQEGGRFVYSATQEISDAWNAAESGTQEFADEGNAAGSPMQQLTDEWNIHATVEAPATPVALTLETATVEAQKVIPNAVLWVDGDTLRVGQPATMFTRKKQTSWKKYIVDGKVRWGAGKTWEQAIKSACNGRSVEARNTAMKEKAAEDGR
jgi:hypothetical protein